MKSSVCTLGVVTALLLAPCLAAQTEETQEQVKFRLKMERFMKESLQKQEELGKEFKKLQDHVQELRDQINKAPKGASLKEELELWKMKLLEAKERVIKGQIAVAEAQKEAILADTLYRALEEKVHALDKVFPEKKVVDKSKETEKPKPIQGKIKKVDPDDPDLVEIDMGSEQGLKGGQTLTVFRMTPQPTYIGSLRLVQVRPTNSVGRMLINPSLKSVEAKVGDLVTSQVK